MQGSRVPPGRKYLPGDWVSEGKLLLFIREEVAARALQKGRRLVEERKRKATAKATASKRLKGARGEAIEAGSSFIIKGDDNDECSELVLMYNSVRGYVSAVNEL